MSPLLRTTGPAATRNEGTTRLVLGSGFEPLTQGF